MKYYLIIVSEDVEIYSVIHYFYLSEFVPISSLSISAICLFINKMFWSYFHAVASGMKVNRSSVSNINLKLAVYIAIDYSNLFLE